MSRRNRLLPIRLHDNVSFKYAETFTGLLHHLTFVIDELGKEHSRKRRTRDNVNNGDPSELVLELCQRRSQIVEFARELETCMEITRPMLKIYIKRLMEFIGAYEKANTL